jgi:hypothetical protein
MFIDYLITDALLKLSISGSYCRALKNSVIREQRNKNVKKISGRNIIIDTIWHFPVGKGKTRKRPTK